ncbi:MAG: hypothetical protein ACQESR_04785 [Planctomycetota bacterium]
MVLCRDTLLVAGGTRLPDADGRCGPGTLRIVARGDGATRAERDLSAAPVLDGMILADSGVFVSTMDGEVIFQAVGFFRVESCPAQAVLPLVGLAAEKVIRERYICLKENTP